MKSPFNEQIKKRQIQPVTGAVASESHELVQIPEDVPEKYEKWMSVDHSFITILLTIQIPFKKKAS